MKQPKVLEIVKEITFKTGLSQAEIAEKIGYSRPHLNRVMHGDEKGSDKVIGRLNAEFPEIVNPMYTVTTSTRPNQVVKPTKENDDLSKRLEDLERRVQEIEVQLKLIVSLLRK